MTSRNRLMDLQAMQSTVRRRRLSICTVRDGLA